MKLIMVDGRETGEFITVLHPRCIKNHGDLIEYRINREDIPEAIRDIVAPLYEFEHEKVMDGNACQWSIKYLDLMNSELDCFLAVSEKDDSYETLVELALGATELESLRAASPIMA